MFHRSHRISHRDSSRRRAGYRPVVFELEDRLAPGQTGVGSAVSMSLLGPALTTWQLDDLATGPVQRRPAITQSAATAIAPESTELVINNLTPSGNPEASVPNTVVPNDTKNPISTAEDLGAQAALKSDDVVSIFDRRVAGPTLPPPGMRRFGDGMERPSSDDGGGRNTVVGPN